MSTDFSFYVYAYLRGDGTPYYVGKGKNKRAWKKHKFIKTPTNINNIIVIENNLTEIGAFALERRLIKWYGRKDLGTGILRNMTDGGDGTCNMSKETKEKISNTHKGIPDGPMPQETKNKISKALTGLIRGPMSDTHKKNLSKSKTGKITVAMMEGNKKQSIKAIGKKMMTREDGTRYWKFNSVW